jgi:hypothetical protein
LIGFRYSSRILGATLSVSLKNSNPSRRRIKDQNNFNRIDFDSPAVATDIMFFPNSTPIDSIELRIMIRELRLIVG